MFRRQPQPAGTKSDNLPSSKKDRQLLGLAFQTGREEARAMTTVARTKAEERYAEIRKRDQRVQQDIQNATRLRAEKTAKLRALRLAKEAEDAAASDINAAGKDAFKRPRKRSSSD
jgi:hypothetical protein